MATHRKPTKGATRKQHIVSRFLLAGFADGEGRLWVYERGKAPRRSRPENECLEKDFYEYEFNGRRTENAYEKWLGRIENNVVHVMPKVLGRERLSRHEATVFAAFVASLFIRTRKVRKQMSEAMVAKFRKQAENPEFLRDLQYQYFQRGELLSEQQLRDEIQQTLASMESSPTFYHIVGIREHTTGLADAIMAKDWHTIDSPEGKSFLISDCPVITVALDGDTVRPGAGFKKQDTAVLLPLTSRQCFIAGPRSHRWNRVAEPVGVDNVNRVIAEFGHRNVYGDANTLETRRLVDASINSVVFGENAFLPNASHN